jgi:molybdate transport system ATP-binding protein
MTLSVRLQHRFADFSLNVAFEAPPGITVLFGPSGSGKSTVINCIAGLLRPDAGRIHLDQVQLLDTSSRFNLPAHRRRIGYVFQDGRLFPHLTVRQNLLFGRWFAGRSSADFDKVVGILGIGPLLERRPTALSGGEKQRVAIGRALMSDPQLLLMDEPLASLDDARKTEILPFLEWIRDESRLPILYVTHSRAEVARLATTLVVLQHGTVKKTGPAADILSDPEFAFAGDIREAGSILPAQVTSHENDGLSLLQISGGHLLIPKVKEPVGTNLRIRILAREIAISLEAPVGLSALNVLPARVLKVLLGDDATAMVQLACGNDLLLAQLTHRSALALGLGPGKNVFAVLKSVVISHRDVGQLG